MLIYSDNRYRKKSKPKLNFQSTSTTSTFALQTFWNKRTPVMATKLNTVGGSSRVSLSLPFLCCFNVYFYLSLFNNISAFLLLLSIMFIVRIAMLANTLNCLFALLKYTYCIQGFLLNMMHKYYLAPVKKQTFAGHFTNCV